MNDHDHVLVAYATVHGSTHEVAEAVARGLREQGIQVEIKAAREVKTLSGYGSVVLGAPLYMFHWHRDARRFLARHRQALQTLPTAVFGMGPFNDVEDEWKGAGEQLDKELGKFEWFQPAARTVFGGKFNPDGLRFPYNLIPAMKEIPASDIRNWENIARWAQDLPQAF